MKKGLAIILCLSVMVGLFGCVDTTGNPLDSEGNVQGHPLNVNIVSGNLTLTSGNASALADGLAIGDLISWNGTAWQRVGPGSAGTFLTSNSTASLPYWSAAAGLVSDGTETGQVLQWNGATWVPTMGPYGLTSLQATTGNFTTLYQNGFQVPLASGTPDYVVGVNTATDDVPGSTGYWVKSGSTGQVAYSGSTMTAAWSSMMTLLPNYTFYKQGTAGGTIAAKQGVIQFGLGRFTFPDQLSIGAGYNLTLIGSGCMNTVGFYGATRPYVGGTELYFEGATYPVIDMPLLAGVPQNPLSLYNISFIVKNPAVAQVNTVYAFNFDGWTAGTWSNVAFMTDVYTFGDTPPVDGLQWRNGNIKGLSIQGGYDHDHLQLDSVTVASFLGDVVTVNEDHLLIGTMSIVGMNAAAAGDGGYALKALTTFDGHGESLIIDRLHLVWDGNMKGIYAPNTNLGPVVINSLTTEYINDTVFAGGGDIRVNDYQLRDWRPTPLADATTFTGASIEHFSYYNLPPSGGNWGGQVHSTQNVGPGSVDTISRLLPILGDVKGLWPFYETTGTNIGDYSPMNQVGTMSPSLTVTGSWTALPRIKGSSRLYYFDADNFTSMFIPDQAYYTPSTGTHDTPFSVGIVFNASAYAGFGRVLMSKAAAWNNAEWELLLRDDGTIQFGVVDMSSVGWRERATAAISLDTWYVLVATYDGSGMTGGIRIYLNGIRSDTTDVSGGAYTTVQDSASRIIIGGREDGSACPDAWLGWPFFTSTALSPQSTWKATELIASMLDLPYFTGTSGITGLEKNSGTATILNGTTSIAVTHGLAITPTEAKIHLVGLENPDNTPGLLWIADNATATQFWICCENDPGASNLDVGWSYQE